MLLEFEKYQGNGNDFIIAKNQALTPEQIQFICHRHYGIGSDGYINVFLNNDEPTVQFYNPDGSESFCGNGSRCALRFVQKHYSLDRNITFNAYDGQHHAELSSDKVKIEMFIRDELTKVDDFYYLNTGAPHAVIECENLEQINLEQEALAIRHHQKFSPIGTNVNFYQIENTNSIAIRTFEKGVEGETLACGTGITATAYTFKQHHQVSEPWINVNAKGGTLRIGFVDDCIWMEGAADFVFKGEIEI